MVNNNFPRKERMLRGALYGFLFPVRENTGGFYRADVRLSRHGRRLFGESPAGFWDISVPLSVKVLIKNGTESSFSAPVPLNFSGVQSVQ